MFKTLFSSLILLFLASPVFAEVGININTDVNGTENFFYGRSTATMELGTSYLLFENSIFEEMFRIDGTGTVFAQQLGIGTDNPTAKLDVRGTGYFSGNVGIGTSNPLAPLQVEGGWGTDYYGTVHLRGAKPTLGFEDTVSGIDWIQHVNAGNMTFYTGVAGVSGWSQKFQIQPSGNVSITGSATLGTLSAANEDNVVRIPTKDDVPYACNSSKEGAIFYCTDGSCGTCYVTGMCVCVNNSWVSEY